MDGGRVRTRVLSVDMLPVKRLLRHIAGDDRPNFNAGSDEQFSGTLELRPVKEYDRHGEVRDTFHVPGSQRDNDFAAPSSGGEAAVVRETLLNDLRQVWEL